MPSLDYTGHWVDCTGEIKPRSEYVILEGTGAYGPLLLAPAEGLGGPSGPLICGGVYFNN